MSALRRRFLILGRIVYEGLSLSGGEPLGIYADARRQPVA